MKRLAAVAGTTLALSLLSVGTAHADPGPAPMVGCGGGYVAPAMSTHLAYATTTWDSGSGSLGIAAPRTWKFVRTPQGEGRFHSRNGLELLSLRTPASSGSTAELMAEQARALTGTSGLRIVGQHTKVSGDQLWSTLAYRYLSSMGEPRTVKVRWIAFGTDASSDADLVLTVAGRPLDGSGLDALLAHVTPTAQLG